MSENFTKQELEQRIKVLENENQDLRKKNEKYLGIINSMSEGYSEVDLKGNLIFFNDKVPEFHGRTRKELMGMPYREYQTQVQREKIFESS